jgi:hypothetical protein|tara:strand:+ start:668 stop:886 length:219 start_codon:yes stop_codon:yes gene_type:complete
LVAVLVVELVMLVLTLVELMAVQVVVLVDGFKSLVLTSTQDLMVLVSVVAVMDFNLDKILVRMVHPLHSTVS